MKKGIILIIFIFLMKVLDVLEIEDNEMFPIE